MALRTYLSPAFKAILGRCLRNAHELLSMPGHPKRSLWVALFQLLPLFAIYPLLKRCTHWPQAWLGFAMNFGFITAWITTTQSFDTVLLSAAITGCWWYVIVCRTMLL